MSYIERLEASVVALTKELVNGATDNLKAVAEVLDACERELHDAYDYDTWRVMNAPPILAN